MILLKRRITESVVKKFMLQGEEESNLLEMFSIGKQNYCIEYRGGYSPSIYELDMKSKSKKFILCFEEETRVETMFHCYDYINAWDQIDYYAVFDGQLKVLDTNYDETDIIPTDFQYADGQYLIYRQSIMGLKIFINDAKTGDIIIRKLLPYDNFEAIQSPSGERILFWISDNDFEGCFIMKLSEFIHYLLTKDLKQLGLFSQYAIDVPPDRNMVWLSEQIICTYACKHIYHLVSKKHIELEIGFHSRNSYLIDGLLYNITEDNILVVDLQAGPNMQTIPNLFHICHYNKATDTFINKQYDTYKLVDQQEFVKYEFKKDYYRDYKIIPSEIRRPMNFIIQLHEKEYGLFGLLPFEIINMIYVQLLSSLELE